MLMKFIPCAYEFRVYSNLMTNQTEAETRRKTSTRELLIGTGYAQAAWEPDPDTDDGLVLDVSGDSIDDVTDAISKLRAAGLIVSENREENGRYLWVVAP